MATDVLTFDEPATRDGLDVERHLDVTDADGWAALAAWLSAETAGSTPWSTTPASPPANGCPHVTLEAWQRTFDINVTGPMLGIQALVPLMPPGSSIVNICSVAAISGHAAAAYTSSNGRSAASPARPPSSSARGASA